MPHIHTAPQQHDLTATAYVVRTDTLEPRVLLHMHRKHNVLLPPGGHVELLETPWQAMAHELEEESGYAFSQLQVLQPISRLRTMTRVVQHPSPVVISTQDLPPDHHHIDLAYGFVTGEDPAITVAKGESTDVRWLTADELAQLSGKEIFANTREIYEFILTEVLSNSEQWESLPATDFAT